MKRLFLFLTGISMAAIASAQVQVNIHENAEDQPIIQKEIYGQFAEHLGRCIYGGIWVGEDSDIPNINGYRKDLVEALQELKVPVLRWPGGCFADEYHWVDGIGPKEDRPKMINTHWGGTVEDNSFGTHEFFNLCELIGCEPYLSGNVGSGTVEELAEWVEYITAVGGTMAEKRAANGRKDPWKLKYIGVGNENWGCGGNMRPEYYADLYRRYATYCRNFDGNTLYKVASGASDYDYNWTKVLMDRASNHMHGLSLHYYTVDWSNKGSATAFDTAEYYNVLAKAVEIDEVISKHLVIMDTYDPEGKVDMILDEWGTWYDVEPGTNPGHLYQQNTMRDAMVAALSLNIFHRYAERLKMANIAQIVNVLQSMILTKDSEIVLTPTYHVFRMYNVHQDASFVPVTYNAGEIVSASGRVMEDISVTASRDAEGVLHVSLVNPVVDREQTVILNFDSLKPKKVDAEILTAPTLQSFNDFGKEPEVAPEAFNAFKRKGDSIVVNLPAASVVTIAL